MTEPKILTPEEVMEAVRTGTPLDPEALVLWSAKTPENETAGNCCSVLNFTWRSSCPAGRRYGTNPRRVGSYRLREASEDLPRQGQVLKFLFHPAGERGKRDEVKSSTRLGQASFRAPA
jgi:hypothetical protein